MGGAAECAAPLRRNGEKIKCAALRQASIGGAGFACRYGFVYPRQPACLAVRQIVQIVSGGGAGRLPRAASQ
ncbi:MAG TPA: hypothetical protein DDZ54_02000, partial [Erythrobacter sp.]|nr:hypothetical protein [Erythrobacter sp.]